MDLEMAGGTIPTAEDDEEDNSILVPDMAMLDTTE
jgi:hypothetical protein